VPPYSAGEIDNVLVSSNRSIQGQGMGKSECVGMWAALHGHGEDIQD
jgi:hypothetical protein